MHPIKLSRNFHSQHKQRLISSIAGIYISFKTNGRTFGRQQQPDRTGNNRLPGCIKNDPFAPGNQHAIESVFLAFPRIIIAIKENGFEIPGCSI
jgi:hypothetical protein